MSGVAGAFFVPEAVGAVLSAAREGDLFAGPSYAVKSYADQDVALVVAGRFQSPSFTGSYAELFESDTHVLACEGYVVNLEELTGRGRADTGERARALLGSFFRDGPRMLSAIEGAYAIVIWNKAEKTATIATSRFGQRQLYRRTTGEGLTVASDLRALRRVTPTPFELDPETVWMSLLYGGVYGGATPVKDVTKVLPGSILTIRRGAALEQPATDLGAGSHALEQAPPLDRLDGALRHALRRHGQVANSQAVMIGSGVDSSLVAAYARREIGTLTALTQQMPGALDESRPAGRIAAALGIPHRVVPYRVGERQLVDDVRRFVRIAEEPAYWNQLGPALLSLLQSLPDRPQAFLTGAEGDFLFNYRPRPVSIARVIRYGLFRPVAAHVARRLINRVTRHTYIVGSDFDLLDRPLMRQHMATCPDVGRGAYYVHEYEHLPAAPSAQRHFLNNGWQNVRIISQFGQEVGSEVLFPYMDDGVVAAVLSLPEELKINKVALRLLLRRFLPASFVPSTKTGYWAHTVRWYYERRALDDVLDLLADRRTLERGTYDRTALGALGGAYAARRAEPRHHPILWQLLLFEMFCREFIDAQ